MEPGAVPVCHCRNHWPDCNQLGRQELDGSDFTGCKFLDRGCLVPTARHFCSRLWNRLADCYDFSRRGELDASERGWKLHLERCCVVARAWAFCGGRRNGHGGRADHVFPEWSELVIPDCPLCIKPVAFSRLVSAVGPVRCRWVHIGPNKRSHHFQPCNHSATLITDGIMHTERSACDFQLLPMLGAGTVGDGENRPALQHTEGA